MVVPETEADWRHAAVGRAQGDQVVWDRAIKDGALVWLTTVTTDRHGAVTFPTPSPAALAFSLAFEAARAAVALRSQVPWRPAAARDQRGLDPQGVAMLYAYFEQSMSAAVFSFQCIE